MNFLDLRKTHLGPTLVEPLRHKAAKLLGTLQETPTWWPLWCPVWCRWALLAAVAATLAVLVAWLWWRRGGAGAAEVGATASGQAELETLLRASPRDQDEPPIDPNSPLPPAGPHDDELLQQIAAVGTGFSARLHQLKGWAQQQFDALQHQFPRCKVAAERALVFADLGSDINVARLLLAGGNPIWAAVSASFIALPYLGMWAALTLTSSGPKHLQERLGTPTWKAQALWLLLGAPLLPLVDLAMLTRHWRQEPKEPQHYHYLKLRGLLEMSESFPQLLLQGYIAIRLWNPFGWWAEVAGYAVPPRSLACSIISSAVSLWLQWDFLNKFGRLQGQGRWTRFLRSMASLGEDLAPSHVFTDLQTKETVDVDLDLNRISQFELMSIARAVKTSKALREVSLRRPIRVWDEGSPDRTFDDLHPSHVTDFIGMCLQSAKLRAFAIKLSSPVPQGFSETVLKLARGDHPSLERFSVNEEQKSWNKPRLQLSDIGDLGFGACKDARSTRSALLTAIRQDNAEVVRALLLRWPGLASESATPLLEAANLGAAAATELLLAGGAVSCKSSGGTFPVLMASRNGHTDCLRLLLQHGGAATVNTVNENSGNFPVLQASSNGHAECLQLLLQHRGEATVNTVNEQSGTFPVLLAAQNGYAECLRLLLQHGGAATVNMVNKNSGNFPVLLASSNGHAECLGLLLQHGGAATVNTGKAATSSFPVLLASENGYAECLGLLLKHGGAATVNAVHEQSGNFPVLVACFKGHTDCLRLLLQHGGEASLSRVWSGDGRTTPVMAAALKGHGDCLRLIEIAQSGVPKR